MTIFFFIKWTFLRMLCTIRLHKLPSAEKHFNNSWIVSTTTKALEKKRKKCHYLQFASHLHWQTFSNWSQNFPLNGIRLRSFWQCTFNGGALHLNIKWMCAMERDDTRLASPFIEKATPPPARPVQQCWNKSPLTKANNNNKKAFKHHLWMTNLLPTAILSVRIGATDWGARWQLRVPTSTTRKNAKVEQWFDFIPSSRRISPIWISAVWQEEEGLLQWPYNVLII